MIQKNLLAKQEGTTNSKTPLDSFENLVIEASRCVKCGRCLGVCPVFKETGRESEVARGKLSIIEAAGEERIPLAPKKLKDIVSFCLLCGSCTENCPNLVPGDAIIRKAREIFTSSDNPSLPVKFALSHILPFPNRMNEIHKAGKILQPLFMKKVPSESGLYWRFPLFRPKKPRLISHLAHEPFLKKHALRQLPSKPAVGLFVGCLSNYVFPAIGEAALDILLHLRKPVFIPQEQACCGLMAFGTGEMEVARRLAKRNIEVFESHGAIPVVAFCSSCSSHLKNYSELFNEAEWRERAVRFSQRVRDLSEFLTDSGFHSRTDLKPIDSSRRLTFHDPCHLRRMQGIFKQPRQLLKNIKGVEFIETGNEKLCCGSGGSFNLSHYDVSLNIFRRRLLSIKSAAVDMVVTSCMGCLLQFLDGFNQEEKTIRVKHLADIVRESL